jgi:hypothetical protein
MESFSTHQAAWLAGCTYRQLDVWARAGLVVPRRELEGQGGPGHWRRWSLRDVTIAYVLGCVPDEWRREVAGALAVHDPLPVLWQMQHGCCELRIEVGHAAEEVAERAAGAMPVRFAAYA